MRLIDASLALYHANPSTDAPGFRLAWEQFCEACRDHIAALPALADVTRNDAGAFGSDSRPTSVAAAFTIPDRGSLRGLMLELFHERPWHDEVNTFADFELVQELPRTANGELRDPRTIASCRRDLVRYGWIEESGELRMNGTRPCIVWVMTAAGRARYEELYNDE